MGYREYQFIKRVYFTKRGSVILNSLSIFIYYTRKESIKGMISMSTSPGVSGYAGGRYIKIMEVTVMYFGIFTEDKEGLYSLA